MNHNRERGEALAEKIRRGDNITETDVGAIFGEADHGGVLYYTMLSMVREQRSLAKLPETLKQIIRTRAWEHWRWVGSEFSQPSLSSYLTSSPPNGIGIEIAAVAKLIAGDAEAEAMFREATTAGKGRPSDNGDNITIKPERGTSRAYTLARLKEERRDLFDRVTAGELTANGAAVIAGWRKSASPLNILRRVWKKASAEERAAFLTEIMPPAPAPPLPASIV